MNKRSRDDLKDLLWGVFWVGTVIGPAVYVVLDRKKREKSHL
jgi:hypothetical protein